MDTQKMNWEESYRNRDNFVFYPHEEVIRFVSKHIRKRVGIHEFKDVAMGSSSVRILDLGCGIGRHVMYCHEMGLDVYGVDLSEEAVNTARKWASEGGVDAVEERLVVSDVRSLPWKDAFFDYAVSHGVLDSMHFEIARSACTEMARVLRPGGLFYCDLVSGDDSAHAREFAGEEFVATKHEEGTIQSYFNFTKITRLIEENYDFVECLLIRNEDVHSGRYISRYHLVLKRK